MDDRFIQVDYTIILTGLVPIIVAALLAYRIIRSVNECKTPDHLKTHVVVPKMHANITKKAD